MNPNSHTFVHDSLPLHWQMGRSEKFAFYGLLDRIKPSVAIEIGTYKGGSLQVISKHAEKVFSIDISDCQHLKEYAPNTTFVRGRSEEQLPKVLKEIKAEGLDLEFVLIDGDHSEHGVRTDIDIILTHQPSKPLFVLMHDSFNPRCRKGMVEAAWKQSPYVHYVEIDWVVGIFFDSKFDTASAGSMWGGLALAQLLPEKRQGELQIRESHKGAFQAAYKQSSYRKRLSPLGWISKAARYFRSDEN